MDMLLTNNSSAAQSSTFETGDTVNAPVSQTKKAKLPFQQIQKLEQNPVVKELKELVTQCIQYIRTVNLDKAIALDDALHELFPRKQHKTAVNIDELKLSQYELETIGSLEKDKVTLNLNNLFYVERTLTSTLKGYADHFYRYRTPFQLVIMRPKVKYARRTVKNQLYYAIFTRQSW